MVISKYNLSLLQAWYRRGKVNVSLGNHEDAARDLNIAHKVELSLGGNREIENELKIISDQHGSSASSVLHDQKLEILGKMVLNIHIC